MFRYASLFFSDLLIEFALALPLSRQADLRNKYTEFLEPEKINIKCNRTARMVVREPNMNSIKLSFLRSVNYSVYYTAHYWEI